MNYLSEEKYSFHDFELDPSARVLSRGGDQIAINAKALEILIELIRSRGELVTKDQLFDAVWPDQFVEENNLTVQISSLRKILGESKGGKQFIATVPGRGYYFVAPLTVSLPDRSSLVPALGTERSDELIGRDRELVEINNLLLNGTQRLIKIGRAHV